MLSNHPINPVSSSEIRVNFQELQLQMCKYVKHIFLNQLFPKRLKKVYYFSMGSWEISDFRNINNIFRIDTNS